MEGADAKDADEEKDETDDLLRRHAGRVTQTGSTSGSGGQALPRRILGITRVRDANTQDPMDCPVSSVGFHKNGQLLLTAGKDKRYLEQEMEMDWELEFTH